MTEKTFDQREALYEIHKTKERLYQHAQDVLALANKLVAFLDALDEWGCDDNEERAQAILEFQKSGYDLSAYEEKCK